MNGNMNNNSTETKNGNTNKPENGDYRKVGELLNNTYMIGTYQRGYRWDEDNVKELLEDVFEGKLFSDFPEILEDVSLTTISKKIGAINNKRTKVDYCLQPLVVKKMEEKKYSVIDGQQRLTTIFIILKALYSLSDEFQFPSDFVIDYQSRRDSKTFLQNLGKNLQEENQSLTMDIDQAYMNQTFDIARKWFLDTWEKMESSSGNNVGYYIEYLEDILKNETKFILDEVNADGNAGQEMSEQKIFADRNTGKIELTESELIKTLFMNPEYYGSESGDIKDRQILISEIWDIYENKLHEHDFWKFLPLSEESKNAFSSKTRIDVIFILLLQRDNIKISRSTEHGLFKAMKSWIENQKENQSELSKRELMDYCWRQVCDVFDGLVELFEDDEIYNLLYLYKRVVMDSDSELKVVYPLYLDVISKNKDERSVIIKLKIKETLFGNEIKTKVKNARYWYQSEVRNIILAYNIALSNGSFPVRRFDYSYYEDYEDEDKSWDVEHIYSTNEDYYAYKKGSTEGTTLKEKKELLEQFKKGEKEYQNFKDYIEYQYGKLEDQTEFDYCQENTTKWFEKVEKRYDRPFEIWRLLKLAELAEDYCAQYEIYCELEKLLEKEGEEFITSANELLHRDDYEEGNVLCFLRAKYMNPDNNLEEAISKVTSTSNSEKRVSWFGFKDTQDFPEKYSESSEEDKGQWKRNFADRCRYNFMTLIYERTQDGTTMGFDNHGDMKENIVDEKSSDTFQAFFKGIMDRIEENINSFFITQGTIDPKNREKLNQDYLMSCWKNFFNDNAIGNMMLLAQGINRRGKYQSARFCDKRQYIATEKYIDEKYPDKLYIPIGTMNVYMGKYLSVDSDNTQWLMGERKRYCEDVITCLEKYFS